MKATLTLNRTALVHALAAAALAAGAACNIPDKICEIDESDNTCSGTGGCVVAYCAADCSVCPAVYSTKQVEEAWCLTPLGESPNDRCREAAESVCTPTSFPPLCPIYIQPLCEEGECVPDFQPPSDP